jgi:prolyl 4-hydroxylase
MAVHETIARVKAMLDARQFADAAKTLAEAAGAGDGQAAVELAHWRIAGTIVKRDLGDARALLGRAAGAGIKEAALLQAGFLAAGVGGPSDWQAALAALHASRGAFPIVDAQLRLIEHMKLDSNGTPAGHPSVEQLSSAPRVAVARALLTAEECDYIAKKGAPALQPSVVVDPATGRMIPHPIRSSDGMQFGVYDEDAVIATFNKRIAAATQTASDQGEPLQLLRYRPGQEYRPHFDALPAEPNQRILTAIVYLNDAYEGGETCFPRTGLTFRGRKGDALIFRNVTDDDRADPLALHAGLPVTRGTKLIATRWIRQKPFTFPPPRPLLDM